MCHGALCVGAALRQPTIIQLSNRRDPIAMAHAPAVHVASTTREMAESSPDKIVMDAIGRPRGAHCASLPTMSPLAGSLRRRGRADV
jgi:hypothetical protein